MEIPLQTTPTAPIKVQQQPVIGAVTPPPPQEQQNAANTTGTPTTPSELGTVGAVNVSRISGQKPYHPRHLWAGTYPKTLWCDDATAQRNRRKAGLKPPPQYDHRSFSSHVRLPTRAQLAYNPFNP